MSSSFLSQFDAFNFDSFVQHYDPFHQPNSGDQKSSIAASDSKETKELKEKEHSKNGFLQREMNLNADGMGTFSGRSPDIQWNYRDELMKREHFVIFNGKKTTFTLEGLLKEIIPFLIEKGNNSKSQNYFLGSEVNPCRVYDPSYATTDIDYHIQLTEQCTVSAQQLKNFLFQLVRSQDGRTLPDHVIASVFFRKVNLKISGTMLFNIAGLELIFAFRTDCEEGRRRTTSSFDSWRLYDDRRLSVSFPFVKRTGDSQYFVHLLKESLSRQAHFIRPNEQFNNLLGRFVMLPSRGVNVIVSDPVEFKKLLMSKFNNYHKEMLKQGYSPEQNIELLANHFFIQYRENRIAKGDDVAELINFLNIISFLSQNSYQFDRVMAEEYQKSIRALCEAWKQSGVVENYKWNCWYENPLGFLEFIKEHPEYVSDIIHFLTAAIFLKFSFGSQTISAWSHPWISATSETEGFDIPTQNSFGFLSKYGYRAYFQMPAQAEKVYSPINIIENFLSVLPVLKSKIRNFPNQFDFLFQMFQLNQTYLIDISRMLSDLTLALKSERVAHYCKNDEIERELIIYACHYATANDSRVDEQILAKFKSDQLKSFIVVDKTYQFKQSEWKALQEFLEGLPKHQNKEYRNQTIAFLNKIIIDLSQTHPFDAIKFYQIANRANLLRIGRRSLLEKLLLNFVRATPNKLSEERKQRAEYNEQIAEIAYECFRNKWFFFDEDSGNGKPNSFGFVDLTKINDICLNSSKIEHLTAVENRIEKWLSHKYFTLDGAVFLIDKINQLLKRGNVQHNKIYGRILNVLLSNPKILEVLFKNDQILKMIEGARHALNTENDLENYKILSDLFSLVVKQAPPKEATLIAESVKKTLFPIPKACSLALAKNLAAMIDLMPNEIDWSQQLAQILTICRKLTSKGNVNETAYRISQKLSKQHSKEVREHLLETIAGILEKNNSHVKLIEKTVRLLKFYGKQVDQKLFQECSPKSLRAIVMRQFANLFGKEYREREWFKNFEMKLGLAETYDASEKCALTFKKIEWIRQHIDSSNQQETKQNSATLMQQYYRDISNTLIHRVVDLEDTQLKEKVINALLETIIRVHSSTVSAETEQASKIATALLNRLNGLKLISGAIFKKLSIASRQHQFHIAISKLSLQALSRELAEKEILSDLAKINKILNQLSSFFKENPKEYANTILAIKNIYNELLPLNRSKAIIFGLLHLYYKIGKNDELHKLFAETFIQMKDFDPAIMKQFLPASFSLQKEHHIYLGLQIKLFKPDELIKYLNELQKISTETQLYLIESVNRYLQQNQLTLAQQLEIGETLLQTMIAFSSEATTNEINDFILQLIRNMRKIRVSNQNDIQNYKPEKATSLLKIFLQRNFNDAQQEEIFKEIIHYKFTEEASKLLSSSDLQKMYIPLIAPLAREDSFKNGRKKTPQGKELRNNLRRLQNISKRTYSAIAIYSTPQNIQELELACKLLIENFSALTDPILSASDLFLAFFNFIGREESIKDPELIPQFLERLFKQKFPFESQKSYEVFEENLLKFITEFPSCVEQLEKLFLTMPKLHPFCPILFKRLRENVTIRYEHFLKQLNIKQFDLNADASVEMKRKLTKKIAQRHRSKDETANDIISKPTLSKEFAEKTKIFCDIFRHIESNQLGELLNHLQKWDLTNLNIEMMMMLVLFTENMDEKNLVNGSLIVIKASFDRINPIEKTLKYLSSLIENIKKKLTAQKQTLIDQSLETIFLEFHQHLIKKIIKETVLDIPNQEETIQQYLTWIVKKKNLFKYLNNLIKTAFFLPLYHNALSHEGGGRRAVEEAMRKTYHLPDSLKFSDLFALINASSPNQLSSLNSIQGIAKNLFGTVFCSLTLYAHSYHSNHKIDKDFPILKTWIFDCLPLVNRIIGSGANYTHATKCMWYVTNCMWVVKQLDNDPENKTLMPIIKSELFPHAQHDIISGIDFSNVVPDVVDTATTTTTITTTSG